jgi:antitoxin ParD1/3/4
MPAKTTSVALGPHFTPFVEKLVASGRYASVSEVIRDGLRMVEARDRELEELRAAIAEGEKGPFYEVTDLHAFFEGIKTGVLAGAREVAE